MRIEPAPVLLAAFIAIGLLSGSCGKNPNGPTGDPTPTPTPIATPTPPPPMRPLEVADLTSDLKAATTCCADEDESNGDEGLLTGWPFITEAGLDLYQRTGVRLTEIRLGPNNGNGGDPGPEESLVRFEETAVAARQRGIYLIVGLYDGWPARHGLNYWGEDCGVMQRAPQAHHREWVGQVVGVARRHPNVILFDGNETWICRPRPVWVNGLIDAAREAGFTGLIGSNARLGLGDYQVDHGFKTVPAGSILLESDNRDHSTEEWRALRAASGGVITYWRGPMSLANWTRLLEAQ